MTAAPHEAAGEAAKVVTEWLEWYANEVERLQEALRVAHEDNVNISKLLARYQSQEDQMDKVILYKDEAGEWRWRREHANGNILSDSSEGYQNLADCRETAVAVNGGDYILVDD